jgi:hypothetical protein
MSDETIGKGESEVGIPPTDHVEFCDGDIRLSGSTAYLTEKELTRRFGVCKPGWVTTYGIEAAGTTGS